VPAFNPDDDVEPAPDVVADFRHRLHESDAVLISTPEYAHGVPGALKNALNWIVGSGELVDKPIGLLNPSPRSTYAQASLKETLTVMSARLVDAASITLSASANASMPKRSWRIRRWLSRFARRSRRSPRRSRRSEGEFDGAFDGVAPAVAMWSGRIQEEGTWSMWRCGLGSRPSPGRKRRLPIYCGVPCRSPTLNRRQRCGLHFDSGPTIEPVDVLAAKLA